jgi:outer membrane protein assembly factor BamB
VVGSGSDRDDNDASITALSADGGEVLWRHDVGKFARSAPTVVDGAVYAGGNNAVYRLDLESGEPAWTFETGALEGASAPDAVFGGIAVVDDTVVAATRSGLVHALDAATGEPRWTTVVEDNFYATPAVVGGNVYIGGYRGEVYAISLADGEVRWRFDTGDQVVAPVAATESTVYAGSETGQVHALATDDGSERWASSATDGDGGVSGGPVLADDAVLVGTGRRESVVAFGADDGTRRWEFFAGGAVRTPVTAVGGAMLVPTLGDELHAVVG